MSVTTAWHEAQGIMGPGALGPDEVAAAFGASAVPLLPPIPFSAAELRAGRAAGEMLVLRTDRLAADKPLTILAMIDRVPDAFDARALRTTGYLLKDEWGIALEPLAATDTCRAAWALVATDVLPASCNRPFDEQAAALARYTSERGLPANALRRRTAVEAVYDTVLHFAAGRGRLLERTWDWTSSMTVDEGFLNIGGFGPTGMQIVGYSPGIRHGALGLCPTSATTG
ncbi:hypothetical protein L6Q96_16250 [Candidatus Binatia bacterium]|nr:hypothetical protein [Candidatus Binatia bacterium]